MKAHPVGIDDRHLPDLVVEDLRPLGPKEAEPHVLGGEGVAVVELQSFAQLEFIDPLIGADGPRLRVKLMRFPSVRSSSAPVAGILASPAVVSKALHDVAGCVGSC